MECETCGNESATVIDGECHPCRWYTPPLGLIGAPVLLGALLGVGVALRVPRVGSVGIDLALGVVPPLVGIVAGGLLGIAFYRLEAERKFLRRVLG